MISFLVVAANAPQAAAPQAALGFSADGRPTTQSRADAAPDS
jgi:hypothetical protein